MKSTTAKAFDPKSDERIVMVHGLLNDWMIPESSMRDTIASLAGMGMEHLEPLKVGALAAAADVAFSIHAEALPIDDVALDLIKVLKRWSLGELTSNIRLSDLASDSVPGLLAYQRAWCAINKWPGRTHEATSRDVSASAIDHSARHSETVSDLICEQDPFL